MGSIRLQSLGISSEMQFFQFIQIFLAIEQTDKPQADPIGDLPTCIYMLLSLVVGLVAPRKCLDRLTSNKRQLIYNHGKIVVMIGQVWLSQVRSQSKLSIAPNKNLLLQNVNLIQITIVILKAPWLQGRPHHKTYKVFFSKRTHSAGPSIILSFVR